MTYAQTSATGALTVSPAPASVTLGLVEPDLQRIGPPGVGHDQSRWAWPPPSRTPIRSGNPVASPTTVGAVSRHRDDHRSQLLGQRIRNPVYHAQPADDHPERPGPDLRRDRQVRHRHDQPRGAALHHQIHGRERQLRGQSHRRGQLPRDRDDHRPNYTGSEFATFVIAPAAINVTGITASNKVYNGSTTATVHAGTLCWWAWSRATRWR